MEKLSWIQWIVMGAIATLPLNTTHAAPVPGSANLLSQLPHSQPLGCRETNSITGVYEQPNLDSTSRGILSQYQAVQLEVASEGWARINYPMMGWVEARYLSPPVSCNELPPELIPPTPTPQSAVSTAASSPQPVVHTAAPGTPSAISTPFPSADPLPSNHQTLLPTFTALCQVVPTDGLIVRSQPLLTETTYRATLPQGQYQFQFTGQTARTETPEGTRTWLYIIAPTEGWISPGFVGATSNLVGSRCG